MSFSELCSCYEVGDALANGARRVCSIELGERFDVVQRLIVNTSQKTDVRLERSQGWLNSHSVRRLLVAILEEVPNLGNEQTTGVVEFCEAVGCQVS
jgi:hypothetical protein